MNTVDFDPGSALARSSDNGLHGLHISSPMEKALADLCEAGSDLAEYLRVMKGIDWRKTSLGALEQWPQELATQFHLMMLNPTAQSMTLGPDAIVVYNFAYADVLRDHHPSFFGTPITEWTAWRDYFPAMQRVMEKAATVGRAIEEKDFIMYLPKNGILEEISLFITVVRMPAPLAGYLATFIENTQTMVRERRISSLKEFSECWKAAPDLDELWTQISSQLSERPRQFSFTALYTATLATDGNSSDSSSTESDDVAYALHPMCRGHDIVPEHLRIIDLASHKLPIIPLMRKAHSIRAPVLISKQDIPDVWQQIAKDQGFGDEVRHAIVMPSSSNKLSKVQALLVLGLCTRRGYDDHYKTFFLEVQRLLSDTVNNLLSTREAFKKKRDISKRARIEKELMEKELALRREQAEIAQLKVGRLTATAETVEVGIFEQRITGEIVEANEAYYRISGCERNPADVVEAFKRTIFAEDLPAISAEWQALASGQNRTFELRYRNGNYGLAACVPLRNHDNEVIGINGVLTNITAVKRVDANEKRFHKFLDLVPAGVLILDSMGRVIFANEDWFKITDHPRAPLDDINWIDVVPPDVQPFLLEKFREVAGGKEITFQLKMKRQYVNAAGEVCGPAWCMVKALAEANEDGGMERCVTTAMDISHQKYAESMQRTRLEEALEAKRQQENFVDLVSHEIRNPLSAIVHCADSITESLEDIGKLIQQHNFTEHGTIESDRSSSPFAAAINSSLEAVETISSCSAHLRLVVDDVLTLSKLDSNMLKIAPVAVSSERFVGEIYKIFSVEAEREEVEFATQIDKSIGQLKAEWVVIDPGRVTQVILNLVSNALKFTKKETRPVRSVKIEMGVSSTRPNNLPVDWTIASRLRDNVFDNAQFSGHESCYLWFKVTDTGCGMTEEEKARIFTRFSQGNVKTFQTYGGSGLGLWICRTLVELQGGEIGVASESGVGSTFSFYVKTHTVEPPNTEGAPLLPVRSNKMIGSAYTDGNLDEPINVLIIEDNLINQRVLKQQLTKQGYVAYVANNGQEALDFLETTRHWRRNTGQGQDDQESTKQNDADVILCDMEMPVMDGLTFSRKLRALQKSGEITTECLPIISVSANARAEQIQAAMDAGMDDSISKPFRIPDLTPKINRLAIWARSAGRA